MKVTVIILILTISTWSLAQNDDSGQYRSDYYGQYSGDDGRYIPDNSGQYIPDDSGAYRGTYDKYIQQIKNGDTDRSRNKFRPILGTVKPYKTVTPKQGLGLYDKRNYAIIRQEKSIDEDGYHYLYETENKIFGEEQGRLANKGTKHEAMRANGYFEYTGPDSIIYRVDYIADENGFVPKGSHLPTPQPIPVAIIQSLQRKN